MFFVYATAYGTGVASIMILVIFIGFLSLLIAMVAALCCCLQVLGIALEISLACLCICSIHAGINAICYNKYVAKVEAKKIDPPCVIVNTWQEWCDLQGLSED
jgi:hypothetical protein